MGGRDDGYEIVFKKIEVQFYDGYGMYTLFCIVTTR